jgi:hypothetical protein
VAAQNILFASGSGGISRFRETVQNAEASTDPGVQAGLAKVNEELKTNVRENHGQYAKQKGADVTAWANAKPENAKPLSQTDYEGDALNSNELAGQHSKSLAKMAQHGKISKEQAVAALDDPRVKANLDKSKRTILENVAGRAPTTDQLNIIHGEANEENARRNSP